MNLGVNLSSKIVLYSIYFMGSRYPPPPHESVLILLTFSATAAESDRLRCPCVINLVRIIMLYLASHFCTQKKRNFITIPLTNSVKSLTSQQQKLELVPKKAG